MKNSCTARAARGARHSIERGELRGVHRYGRAGSPRRAWRCNCTVFIFPPGNSPPVAPPQMAMGVPIPSTVSARATLVSRGSNVTKPRHMKCASRPDQWVTPEEGQGPRETQGRSRLPELGLRPIKNLGTFDLRQSPRQSWINPAGFGPVCIMRAKDAYESAGTTAGGRRSDQRAPKSL